MKKNILIILIAIIGLSSFNQPQKTILKKNDIRSSSLNILQTPLKGVYTRTKRGLYKSLEFKGTKTVVIKPFIGWGVTATYERDGNTIIMR